MVLSRLRISSLRVVRNNSIRSTTRSFQRFSTATEKAAEKEARESALTTITFEEQAKAGVNYAAVAGITLAGGFAAFALYQYFNPWQLSANSVFNNSFEFVRNHSEVTARLGTPIKGYGRDYNSSREGRRNIVDSDKYKDDDDLTRVRVKYNVEGPNGKGVVYAEQSSKDLSTEFSYIIFEPHMRGRHETIGLVDNRKQLSREELQDKITKKFANAGMVLFGHTNCQWTKKQREELGEFADRVKTIYCDKKENEEECSRAQLKGYPTWRYRDQNVPGGYQTLDQLQSLARLL